MVEWDLMGFYGDSPLVMSSIAMENGPVEIVDLPINSMVIFHSYVADTHEEFQFCKGM